MNEETKRFYRALYSIQYMPNAAPDIHIRLNFDTWVALHGFRLSEDQEAKLQALLQSLADNCPMPPGSE